jgi:hypothetical protein
LAVPVTEARPMFLDRATETPTTVAPATATVHGQAPQSSRSRRLGALALVAGALAVLSLRWVGVSAKPSEPAAQNRELEPATPPAISATTIPTLPVEPAHANATPAAKPLTPSRTPNAARAVLHAASAVDSAAPPPTSDPVPVEPAPDSEVDLTRLRKREKKPARALDTADPWSH